MARHTIASRSPHAKPAVSARRGTPASSTSGDHHSFLPSVKKHRTIEELAYLDIRHAITEGRFAPGERIVVSSLAAASGVSRISVMQALRRLETEGFVRITPHKMATLEALCLREAAGKITPTLVKQCRALQAELVAARKAKDAARAAMLDGEFHLLRRRDDPARSGKRDPDCRHRRRYHGGRHRPGLRPGGAPGLPAGQAS